MPGKEVKRWKPKEGHDQIMRQLDIIHNHIHQMAKSQEESTAEVKEMTQQVIKVQGETRKLIDATEKLIAEVEELKKNQQTSAELDAALQEAIAQVKVADELVPDAPPEATQLPA